MNIGYRPLSASSLLTVKAPVNNGKKINIDNRQELSNVLFGERKIHSSNISFGWSKGIDRTEEEILDLLTNPLTKNVIVSCHIKPDADATGSAIGIAGILKKLGVFVFPILDDKIPPNLKQLPTCHRGIKQEDFFKSSNCLKDAIEINNIKEIDVAVLTDSALPTNVSSDMLNIASTAKKVVIIDHHCGQTPSAHYELWVKKLTEVNPNFDEDNLFYWCDSERSSASEMVAELDKEIYDEFKTAKSASSSIKNRYNNKELATYRYSVAAGILDDSGARLNSLDEIPRFPRASKKMVELKDGNKVSSTEAYYRWLVNHAGAKKINLKQVNNNEKNTLINKEIFNLLSGKSIRENLLIKVPDNNSNYGVLDLTNTTDLEEFVSEYDCNAKTAEDVAHLFKLRAIDKINAGESDLYVIANKSLNDGKLFLGVYSADNLAIKVVNKLISLGMGDGGGHDSACVIRFNEGHKLDDNVRKVIDDVVKGHHKKLNAVIAPQTLRLWSEIIDYPFFTLKVLSENLIKGTETVFKSWSNALKPE